MRKSLIFWWVGVFIVFVFPFLYGRFISYGGEWNITISYLSEFWFWGIYFNFIALILLLIGASITQFKTRYGRWIVWALPILLIAYYAGFFIYCGFNPLNCG